MSTRKFLISTALIAALGATSLATMASAAGRGGPDMPAFTDLDTNGDGQVSVAELEALQAARFADTDTNGDGVLSVEEITAHAAERASERAARMAERMIDRLDEDGDGAISADEAAARGPNAERMIERLDENGDGTISEEEFAEAERHRGPRGGHRGGHGDRGGRGE